MALPEPPAPSLDDRLLIVRAPIGISLAGSGTDFEAYYEKYGGAGVSVTVDKYFYVFVSRNDGRAVEISSSNYRTLYNGWLEESPQDDASLQLARRVIDHFGIASDLSVFFAAQLPAGAGLGFGSTLAVALVTALSVLRGEDLSHKAVAALATRLEKDIRGTSPGEQDPYATSLGGLNFIQFSSDGVSVEPIDLGPITLRAFEQRLMLFFTGPSKNQAEILNEQTRSTRRNRATAIEALHVIKDAAIGLREDLLSGDTSSVGAWLHRSWVAKRQLAHAVSNPWIDQWYEAARAAGASGGTLVGPGGGGFLLLAAEPRHQAQVTETLGAIGLSRLGFRLEFTGPTVIMNTLTSPVQEHAAAAGT